MAFLAARRYRWDLRLDFSRTLIFYFLGALFWSLGELGWDILAVASGFEETPYPSIADVFGW
ncbi:TPA: hypothetical protein EYP44_00345 [Candidatus Bathyarchaeota archaeon]|nr:hypothetical protein [Candidatus Bathyarchaeota archaeon]